MEKNQRVVRVECGSATCTVPTRPEDLPCHYSLTVPLEKDNIQRYKNGSIFHDGTLYPTNLYWIQNNSIRGCVCELRPCMRKCCRDGEVLSDGEIARCKKIQNRTVLPDIKADKEQFTSEIQHIKNIADHYILLQNNFCPNKSYKLEPENFEEDKFIFEANGTLHVGSIIYPQWNFCIDWHESLKKITVLICFQPEEQSVLPTRQRIYPIMTIVSIPFLIITFIVYAIIPELRNIYGKTLMCYVACLTISYCFLINLQLKYLPPEICLTAAFCMYFFFLASFYWLNVMCFDIWWTFGGFRALRGSMKQRDRKKFIIYSIYAWGIASFFTSICLIMDFAPNIPENTIRPQLGEKKCWFTTNSATNIYFTLPMTISIVCNLCLFISTALKIRQHTKDTAHHLRGSESRRHDDNKQWFNLYMKLFIVMGITWTTEIISTLWEGSGDYIWYISDVINTLQGLIIFITLVCKQKIKRLLLKRFGYSDGKFFSRSLTRSVYHSSASRTTCTTTTGLPLQEKVDANIQREAFRLSKESAEESDCP
ncbi:PREDICTED: G-protein coupled receptor Mth2-like [Polistes canadensis]|uniref:G-protein coupled receptor Mth2-like n=1 Tax=Polistes canadensis TaxID=91411 RepID=UPI000718CB18|nr:PREDICTED: G-protein coupled receptor Mth2-like [Polistes canadensis]